VADALLGRRVRCFGCNHAFLAVTDRPAPPAPREKPPAPRPSDPARAGGDFLDDERGPYCPGCGRRITWGDVGCPHCGEELEPEDTAIAGTRRLAGLVRRDYEPHRGPLIASLGNLSMILGGLSLCLLGAGALFSVPLGIAAWMMANRDLERMREGLMDPRGKVPTETGRAGAIAGILLGLIFGAFYVLVYLGQ
jgi:hypothetical protein